MKNIIIKMILSRVINDMLNGTHIISKTQNSKKFNNLI